MSFSRVHGNGVLVRVVLSCFLVFRKRRPHGGPFCYQNRGPGVPGFPGDSSLVEGPPPPF